jgi:exodeoxyribonuclease VII small subunit
MEDKMNFEDALAKLEAIVSKMEEGKMPIEEMMKAFEEGNALAKICSDKLNKIEKKIEILVKKNESGGEWKDFPPKTKSRESDTCIGDE